MLREYHNTLRVTLLSVKKQQLFMKMIFFSVWLRVIQLKSEWVLTQDSWNSLPKTESPISPGAQYPQYNLRFLYYLERSDNQFIAWSFVLIYFTCLKHDKNDMVKKVMFYQLSSDNEMSYGINMAISYLTNALDIKLPN